MNTRTSTSLALILPVFFWGFGFIAIKFALRSFTPSIYMFLRFTIASAIFMAFLLYKYKGFPSFDRKTHGLLFLAALFEPGLYYAFETYGMTMTTASKASIIIATSPILVMILACILLGEKISKKSFYGIIFSFVGIVILVIGGSTAGLSGNQSLTGDLLLFAAAISAALYMVIARNLGTRMSSLDITSFQMFYGTLFFLPVFIIQSPSVNWSAITGESIGALLFLVLFPTVGGYFLYNYALSQVPASRASVFMNGIPVVTTIAAVIILGEHLSLLQLIGGIIAITAVALANWPQRGNDVAIATGE